MQVAPSSPRAAKLREADLRKLLGTLSALLEQSPGRAARLVVFDLEQQKVLFRKDEFTQADFQNLAKLIDELAVPVWLTMLRWRTPGAKPIC